MTPARDRVLRVQPVLSLPVEYLGELPIPSTLLCELRGGRGFEGWLWLTCDRDAAEHLTAKGEVVLTPLEYRLIARLAGAGMLGRITVRRALEAKTQDPFVRIDADALGWRGGLPAPPPAPVCFEDLLERVGADLTRIYLADEWRDGLAFIGGAS